MKKNSLTLGFLLLSNINLYAAHITDAHIDTILAEFGSIEDALKRNPDLAQYSLNQLQNNFGLHTDFDRLFGDRYADLTQRIKAELDKKANYLTAQFHEIVVSASEPGSFPDLANTKLPETTLSIDSTKNSKDALEEALNNNKYILLQNIFSINQISMIYIELKNVIVQNKSHGFNTKLTSGVLNKKPLELNLDKLMTATDSHISVTLIDNK